MENRLTDTQSIHSVCPVTKNSQVCSYIKLRCQKALCLLASHWPYPCSFFLNVILGQCHQLTWTDSVSEIPTNTFQQSSLKMLLRILLGILKGPFSLRGLKGEIFLRGRKSCFFLSNWFVFLLQSPEDVEPIMFGLQFGRFLEELRS